MATNTSKGKGVSGSSVPAIKPEPGWKPRGRFGVMKTPDGTLLVALADVACFLRDRDGLTKLQAVDVVINAITPADIALLWNTHFYGASASLRSDRSSSFFDLHWMDDVDPDDHEIPTLVDGPSAFKRFAPHAPLKYRNLPSVPREHSDSDPFEDPSPELKAWLAKPESERKLDLFNEKERRSLLSYLSNPSPNGVNVQHFHALPHYRAHELWGWGSKAQDTAQAPTSVQTNEEDGERLWHELQALEVSGCKTPMKTLSERTGIPDRKIRHLVKPYRDKKGKPKVLQQSWYPTAQGAAGKGRRVGNGR